MKFIINSAALNKALKQVSPAISPNKIMPMLDYIHCYIDKKNCRLTATNTNLTISVDIDCENKDSFEVLLPFKELLNITSVLFDPIEINCGKEIEIKSTGQKEVYKLGSNNDVDKFPAMPDFKSLFSIDVDKEFLYNLQLSKNCVSKDVNDMRFKDVYIEVNNKRLMITSTDSSQMFRYTKDVNNEDKIGWVVNVSFIKALVGFVEGTISGNDRFFKFVTSGVTITTTISEQKYPDCDKVFIDVEPNCVVSKEDTVSAINRMMVFDSRFYFFDMFFSKKNVSINYEDSAMKQYFKTDIPATHSVEFNKISFNGAMFKNLFSLLPETDYVQFAFTGENGNVHISTKGNKKVKMIIRPIIYNHQINT